MKYLLRHNFVLFILFVTILSSSIYANDDDWIVEIELSEQTYILHQPIWLDITLTNNTSDTLRTDGLEAPNNHYQFTIEFKDVNGDAIEYTGPMYSFASVPGRLLLEAGEQDYGCYDLLRLFGATVDNSGFTVLYWRFPYIPAGTYTVQVHFEGIPSNKLTMDIVEPVGHEKEVLDLIEKASSTWAQDNTEPSALIFQEIVGRFPNSVFAEQCFYLSTIYLQTTMDGMRQGVYDKRVLKREMLRNYPNSGNSKSWLFAVTYELGDDAKATIVNKVIEDSPNTRGSRFAKQMLRKLQ